MIQTCSVCPIKKACRKVLTGRASVPPCAVQESKAASIRRETLSKPLTFKELDVGDRFIAFPKDGDDFGHGGYRGSSYVFTKLRMFAGKPLGAMGENAARSDGTLSRFPPDLEVLHLIPEGVENL